MSPTEFFTNCGVTPTRFERGLLAVPNNTPISMGVAVRLEAIPRCGEEFQLAYLTCFCETERELLVALSTASQVANKLQEEHDAAGCI